jgi:hypothetical protein
MSKKSQMEIFGIALIVIIMALAMFFFISSRLKASNIKQGYMDTEMAQNMLNTIFRTKTECGLSVSDVAKDCATGGSKCDMCTSSPCPPRYAGITNSCNYLNFTVTNILEGTLKLWQKPYYFTITYKKNAGTEGPLLNSPISSGGCNLNKEREAPGMQYIPVTDGRLTAQLVICK